MAKKTYEFVMNTRTPNKVIAAELGKVIVDPDTRQVIGRRPPKKLRFVNGVFETSDPKEVAFLKAHPYFNDVAPSRGFTEVTNKTVANETMVAKKQAPAAEVGYENLTVEYLRELCEERKVTSYGNKSKLVEALMASDAEAADGGAQKALENMVMAACKKYTKSDLIALAEAAGVEVSMNDVEPVIVETMISAGVEL